MKSLFVTGTDTDVGKTWISCLLIRQLVESGCRVGAYKPACSGAERTEGTYTWHDIDSLNAAINVEVDTSYICPQRFRAALAPNVAARQQNEVVDEELLNGGLEWWNGKVDYLVVEGVGGFLCPLSDTSLVADLASTIGSPVLIVAANRLGVINHTALTIDAVSHRGLPIAGVVINETVPENSPEDATLRELNNHELRRICGQIPLLRCRYQSVELTPCNSSAEDLSGPICLFS